MPLRLIKAEPSLSFLFLRCGTPTRFSLLSAVIFCLFYLSPIQGRPLRLPVTERGRDGGCSPET